MPYKLQVTYRLDDEAVVPMEPELFPSFQSTRIALIAQLIETADAKHIDKIVIVIEKQ